MRYIDLARATKMLINFNVHTDFYITTKQWYNTVTQIKGKRLHAQWACLKDK